MKTLLNKAFFLIMFATLLFACGKSEQDVKAEREIAMEQERKDFITLNETRINDLATKYKALSRWDTLKLFTYRFQEILVDSCKLINFEGVIKDILKLDSTFIVKIHCSKSAFSSSSYDFDRFLSSMSIGEDGSIIGEFKIIETQIKRIQNLLQSKKHSRKGAFICKVSNILTAYPAIKSNFEPDGESSYSYLSLDFDESLMILKGEVVDFYLEEIPN
jgi:hypothetical protein